MVALGWIDDSEIGLPLSSNARGRCCCVDLRSVGLCRAGANCARAGTTFASPARQVSGACVDTCVDMCLDMCLDKKSPKARKMTFFDFFLLFAVNIFIFLKTTAFFIKMF